MTPARRTPKTRHRKKHNWLMPVAVIILIVVVGATAYLAVPKSNSNQGNSFDEQTQDTAFNQFTSHYLNIMKNLNSTQTKNDIASRLDSSLNQTDLFTWQQSKMVFAQDLSGWYEDPSQILDSGRGICVQWSIVYVSACLSLGYQSRLVVAADAASWQFIHTWAEDYVNGSWVHVDPSDRVWNQPSRYQSWNWGNAIGHGVEIYAFQDGSFQDVTSSYSTK